MARRITMDALKDRVSTLERDNHIALRALNDAASGKVNWFARKSEPESKLKYRFGVSRLDMPCGGILYTQTIDERGDAYTTVQYLDEAYAWIQKYDGSASWQFMHEPIMQAVRLRSAAMVGQVS